MRGVGGLKPGRDDRHSRSGVFYNFLFSFRFFVVEDHILHTTQGLVNNAYMEELWAMALSKIIAVLRTHSVGIWHQPCPSLNWCLRIASEFLCHFLVFFFSFFQSKKIFFLPFFSVVQYRPKSRFGSEKSHRHFCWHIAGNNIWIFIISLKCVYDYTRMLKIICQNPDWFSFQSAFNQICFCGTFI